MTHSADDTVGAGDIQDLAVAVEQLTEETRILRQSIDELRDDVVWAARQVLATGYEVSGTPPPSPIDPLAPNADSESDDPLPATHPPPGTRHRRNETAEEATYCCEQPNLRWSGDPDSPGVACENCGYVVADQGSVVIWREEAEFSAAPKATPKPIDRQGGLFD